MGALALKDCPAPTFFNAISKKKCFGAFRNMGHLGPFWGYFCGDFSRFRRLGGLYELV
jgi:hypothetical protein